MSDALKLAIPSKGRLQSQTQDWFGARGIKLERTGSEREYSGRVAGVGGVELVLLSAGEIPRALAEGRVHLGVTGLDLIQEQFGGSDSEITVLHELGFGFADLIIAVPNIWIDVDTIDDLDAAAGAFRARHGFRLRIATKYHALVRNFLQNRGVADYQLIDSQGATEGTVRNLAAEAIADITTTGSTLSANHLKIIDDGLILKSQAVLAQSATAHWSKAASTALADLSAYISGDASAQ